MNPTALTPHFFLEEFIYSNYARRHGINNNPNPVVKQNLILLATKLELVRDLLQAPLTINSGYRCTELNRDIGGASDSAHLSGYAADFTCYAFGQPEKIVTVIKASGLKYDQLICEGTWVHISFDPQMRQQTLRALFDARGKAAYSTFI